MTDLISRADAIKAVEQEYRIDRGYMVDDYTYGFNQAIHYVSDIILQDLPSAELPKGDLISRADAICEVLVNDGIDNIVDRINALPSAEAVTIHDDGTLEVKVPNAHKVGRVLVMDTDSHIGGDTE